MVQLFWTSTLIFHFEQLNAWLLKFIFFPILSPRPRSGLECSHVVASYRRRNQNLSTTPTSFFFHVRPMPYPVRICRTSNSQHLPYLKKWWWRWRGRTRRCPHPVYPCFCSTGTWSPRSRGVPRSACCPWCTAFRPRTQSCPSRRRSAALFVSSSLHTKNPGGDFNHMRFYLCKFWDLSGIHWEFFFLFLFWCEHGMDVRLEKSLHECEGVPKERQDKKRQRDACILYFLLHGLVVFFQW